MKTDETITRAIRPHVQRAVQAANRVKALLDHPAGRTPEQLEDALNELQEAGFDARRGFSEVRARFDPELKAPDSA